MDVRVGVNGGFMTAGGLVSPGVSAALPQLIWAREYAAALQTDPWQFAVELDELAQRGLTRTDLRWLLGGGLVEHREETTSPQSATRTFRPLAAAAVPPRTALLLSDLGCRVLSPLVPMPVIANGGAAVAGWGNSPSTVAPTPSSPTTAPVASGGSHPLPTSGRSSSDSQRIDSTLLGAGGANWSGALQSCLSGATDDHASRVDHGRPAWDRHLRELWLGERLVKRFRVPADNQEVILGSFEEDGWPEWIDDPLPPARDLDPKRRLQATIKSLNRNQIAPVLRFHGNGGGDVVYWSVT